MPKRVLKGRVVSNSAAKTVVVSVERTFAHPMYKKIVRKTKKYHAHDEKRLFKVGDNIQIIESRPISKTKKWQVIYQDSE